MKDQDKTKGQLLEEVRELRQRIAELEASETARERAKGVLRESEERFKSIMESVHDVIFQLSPSGFIQYVSPKIKELYGFKPEDLIGKNLKKTTPISEVPKALKALKSVLSGKVIKNFEIHQLDSKGKSIPMEITLTPVKKAGKIIGIRGVMRDITERKRAEQALRESEERLQALIENTNDIVYSANAEGQLTHVSPQIKRLGISPEEIVSKRAMEYILPEDREKVLHDFQKTMMTGEEFPTEFRVRDKEGNIHWFEDIGRVQRGESGNIVGLTGVLRDITERKKAEEERDKLIGELQEALSNINILQGLLPICSSCKKIRDDEGYWHQVEAYIRDHSDAKFSHGLCPDCLKELYPEYHKDDE